VLKIQFNFNFNSVLFFQLCQTIAAIWWPDHFAVWAGKKDNRADIVCTHIIDGPMLTHFPIEHTTSSGFSVTGG
jgi:hypothetical protein